MAKKNQHVIPLGNVWAVKGEGNKRFSVITEKKRDAVTVARVIAKSEKSELIIHGKDGKIQDRDSFRENPHPLRDKKHLKKNVLVRH